jgi:hypothetical protein
LRKISGMRARLGPVRRSGLKLIRWLEKLTRRWPNLMMVICPIALPMSL